MKRFVFAVCLLFATSTAFAQEPISLGSGLSGITLSGAYQGAYLHYEEIVDNSVLDKDTGWLNGGFVEARYDTYHVFLRANFDMFGSDTAQYTDFHSFKFDTRELYYRVEADAGYKLFNFRTATISPYVGIGYFWWERGRNILPDYEEDYSWAYAAFGLNYAHRFTDRFLFGVDAALLWPFDTKMKTDIAGTIDRTTFDIKPRLGWRVQVPMSYELTRTYTYRVFTFLTPFYERWNIGASPDVAATSGGVPTGDVFFEPKSHTDLYGFRLGFGINF